MPTNEINMHPSVVTALPNFLKQYEGKVNFMYLDVKGLVTVGVGHLLASPEAALGLEFCYKGGGSTASGGEVSAEWSRVKASTSLMGQGSAAFNAITKLELSNKGIETMVKSDSAGIENYIKTNAAAKAFYADFDKWPADAQLAFMGIAWGGMPLPQFGWHKFPIACRDQDWDTAANECKISSPIAAGRNEAHRLMFINASAIKANREDITELAWPLRHGRSG